MGKIRVQLFCLLALALALGGCGPDNVVNDYANIQTEEHHLHFFGNKYEASNVAVIEEILTAYMQENQTVLISYESLKSNNYYSALARRAQAGRLDDVFMINHDSRLDFKANGRLADLTELAEAAPFSEEMLSQMREPDGRIYWVPTMVSAFGLYCNLDLLAEHKQPVPQNLAEWKAVCDYFVGQGIVPIVVNNDVSLKTLALAKGFYPLYQQGEQAAAFALLNSGEASLSDYLRPGWELVQEFCAKGYVDTAKALETSTTSDDLREFVQGKSPFMLTGAWAAGRVKGMEPDFEFLVMAYPVLEDGCVLVINPDVRLSVAAESENLALAQDFVAYFLQEENITRFANSQASFSPLLGDYRPNLREVQPIVASYRNDTLVLASDSGLNFPIWGITEETARDLLSGQDLTTALQQMDEQVVKNRY